jgi:hypothetical protein
LEPNNFERYIAKINNLERGGKKELFLLVILTQDDKEEELLSRGAP